MGKHASLSWKHVLLSCCPQCTCCKAPVKQFLAPIRSPFFQYCSPNVFQPSTRPGSSFTARERHSSATVLKSGATFRHRPFCSRNSALCLKWSRNTEMQQMWTIFYKLKRQKRCCVSTTFTFCLLQLLQCLFYLLRDVALFPPSFLHAVSLKIAISEIIQVIHELLWRDGMEKKNNRLWILNRFKNR